MGSGLIGSAAGCLVLVTLLLFAVQLTTNLRTASTTAAAAGDAARRLAGRAVDHHDPSQVDEAQHRAEADIRRQLRPEADHVVVRWVIDARRVTVIVQARPRRVAPLVVAERVGLDVVERRATVLIEQRP